MPESDSPLSTTSSVIAIITLVAAVTFTLQYYAKVLYQADLAGEVLLARMVDSLMDVGDIQSALQRFAKTSPHVMKSEGIEDDKIKKISKKAEQMSQIGLWCVIEWRGVQSEWKATESPERTVMKYLSTLKPTIVGAVKDFLKKRRSIKSPAVMVLYCIACILLFVPYIMILSVGWILYGAVLYALIWIFHSPFGSRLRVAKKQSEIADKMEKFDAATNELRSKLMLQLLLHSQESIETTSREFKQSHNNLTRLIFGQKKGNDESSKAKAVTRQRVVLQVRKMERRKSM